MNRRNAIGNIVMLSIGAVVLPSCGEEEQAPVTLKNYSITASEEKMLGQLSDTIIPKTNFIGAADTKAQQFTLMMVDDCYEPEKQKEFVTGMKEFEKISRNQYGGSFTRLTPAQKEIWLAAIEKKEGIPEAVIFFYETTKKHTVQSFTSSKEYMTGILKYNMVPGSNFKGCVPVKQA